MTKCLSTIVTIASCLLLTMTHPMALSGQESKEQETVYSGPQIGEILPVFKMKMGFGDKAGTEVDLVDSAGTNPIAIIFVHKRSRPAFGLANTVMRYCNEKGGDKLTRGICFLTADPTDTQNWLGKIQRYFPSDTPVGYSAEGVEGPGSYGLNRNVELTVLVAKDKKVTANFALVQPGAHVDGPKILSAIAQAVGSDEKPDINQYLNSNQSIQDAPIAIDPGLMEQVKKLGMKDASDESVGEAILEIEKMTTDNKALQRQLGTILSRWSRANRIESIGNEEHQKKLIEWSRKYAPKMGRRMNRNSDRPQSDRPRGDAKLTGLLRSVIQKSNTNDQVDAAAKAVEEYVDSNPAAAKELARIAKTVTGSDKLSNYGTEYAQEILKAWARKYGSDKK